MTSGNRKWKRDGYWCNVVVQNTMKFSNDLPLISVESSIQGKISSNRPSPSDGSSRKRYYYKANWAETKEGTTNWIGWTVVYIRHTNRPKVWSSKLLGGLILRGQQFILRLHLPILSFTRNLIGDKELQCRKKYIIMLLMWGMFSFWCSME